MRIKFLIRWGMLEVLATYRNLEQDQTGTRYVREMKSALVKGPRGSSKSDNDVKIDHNFRTDRTFTFPGDNILWIR